MDLWRLITNDHANIADLCGDIPRAPSGGGVRSRERLFDQLDSELRRHIEAEEESLFEALEDHDRTEHLIEELEDEHEEIERQLKRLARSRDKSSREWLMGFRDLAALIEQHFHREEHELLPAAREILSDEQARDLRDDFAEEKIEELQEARRHGWGVSPGVLVGALMGVAAGAAAFAAWRGGSLAAGGLRLPTRLKRFVRPDRRAARRYGPDILRDIAERTRCPVQDVSSRLQLPIGTTFAVVADLERRGLVRSVRQPDVGGGRVVAITTRGRQEVRNW